ncbi:MAG: serine hydrolase, partial [Acidobacteriota bacterium]
MRALFTTLVSVLLYAPSLAAQQAPPNLDAAFSRIDEFVAKEMSRSGTPGLALALTSRTGPLRVSTYGYRDVEEGTPVTSETLFQIGS